MLLKVILGDGAVVCGLPVVFESLCEKKGGGPDGQRNWFKGGRRNWKARHLRLTSRWLQYLDAPLPAGVLKGSKEICPEWTVSYNSKHANAIVIECSGEEVLNVRFASQEVEPAAAPLSRLSHVIFTIICSSAASGRTFLKKQRRIQNRDSDNFLRSMVTQAWAHSPMLVQRGAASSLSTNAVLCKCRMLQSK